jgi:hypothetical protein
VKRRARAGTARAKRCAPALLAGCALLGGCGEIRPADLFLVERTGTVPGARLTLLVDEQGGVTCNGARASKLGDPQLLEARAIEEDLRPIAGRHTSLAPAPGSVLRYHVREQSGSVSFSDNSPAQPKALHRLALFVLQTAQHSCHLAI